MRKNILFAFLFLMGAIPSIAQKNYQVQSPNRDIKVEVTVADKVAFSIVQDHSEVMNSAVSMTLQGGEVLGANPKVLKVTKTSVDKEIPSPFYKKDVVKDIYNEMQISFRGNYGLVFRVYNDGVAYRFTTKRKEPIVIADEEAVYNFPSDYKTFTAYVNSTKPTFEEQFFNSFEQPYVNETISSLNDKRLKILPLLVDLGDGRKVCITEADLEDFPGMFLNNETGKPSLKAVHAPYPKVKEQGGHNQLQMLVKERENYIAKTSGTRSFPWRAFIISRNDKELADCDMVYRLASPSRVNDISWIKPGKVAWDWWNDWNLYGVDFRAGINNPTYKYYIDFAAEHGRHPVEHFRIDPAAAQEFKLYGAALRKLGKPPARLVHPVSGLFRRRVAAERGKAGEVAAADFGCSRLNIFGRKAPVAPKAQHDRVVHFEVLGHCRGFGVTALAHGVLQGAGDQTRVPRAGTHDNQRLHGDLRKK